MIRFTTASVLLLITFPVTGYAVGDRREGSGLRAPHALQAPQTVAASRAHSASALLVDWAKALPITSTEIGKPDMAEMFGGQIATLAINVALPLREVAAALTRARPWVRHLNVLPGEMMLSGQQDGVNWIAALTPASPTAPADTRSPIVGTRGVLSIWLAASPSAFYRAASLVALAMPPAARLIFDLHQLDQNRAASMQLWRAPSIWRDPCNRMAASLREAGWQSVTPAGTNVAQWTRANEITTLQCHPDGSDTLIFLQRTGAPR